jgi:transglutaminase-like putative cysteine protease/predicted glutamine amidotransferase
MAELGRSTAATATAATATATRPLCAAGRTGDPQGMPPNSPPGAPEPPALGPQQVKREEHKLTRLLALSFDGSASPSIGLRAVTATPRERRRGFGWGFAWYPGVSAGALVVKDATSIGENAMTKLLAEWERFESTIFVCHLRGAARTLLESETQPFQRSYAGRDWVFAHNGDLECDVTDALPLGDRPAFEPVGRSDSEHAFCWLLNEIRARGARRLSELGWPTLLGLLRAIDRLGTANMLLTDGIDLVVHSDDHGYNPLHWARFTPPHKTLRLAALDINIDLTDATDRTRTIVVVATQALTQGDSEARHWSCVPRGHIIVLRRGSLLYDSAAAGDDPEPLSPAPEFMQPPPPRDVAMRTTGGGAGAMEREGHGMLGAGLERTVELVPIAPPTQPEGADAPAQAQAQLQGAATAARAFDAGLGRDAGGEPASAGAPGSAHPATADSGPGPYDQLNPARPRLVGPPSPVIHVPYPYDPERRIMRVVHETAYRYERPVERSSHLFRLRPVQDSDQEIVEHTLDVNVDGLQREYDDVFGNASVRMMIERPYTELTIRSAGIVRLRDPARRDPRAPERRLTIPLVWMPWQRQMMLPYLLPPELPETQLTELYEYAMSFVARRDNDLIDTLIDINTTIFRDYAYVSGSTTLATTAFNVYANRRGVCQDFANLFICLARLLNVPARYRVGYIYTGENYENKVQSDASHAWVETYFPWFGWVGFDPTNGVMVNLDHVRVAAGRNYRDATPTSGTIYKGGGFETLTVLVRTELLE